MTWASSHLFVVLIPLLLLIAAQLVRHYYWQRRTVIQLGSQQLKNFSLRKAAAKLVLRLLSLLFLVLAFGRPQWGTTEQIVEQQGRDVLIALDISRSMLAQDVQPSRLEAAKKKIAQLIERLTAERVSLMVFSGIAVVQCPFTSDIGAFMSFLDLSDTEAVSSGTTSLDKAIDLGIKTFNAIPGRKQRIMVLFTDGEDFSRDQTVAQRAQQAGLHLFTIGVGTPEGAPIPIYDHRGRVQGHLKDDGSTVITKLDEAHLSQIAQQTNGTYLRMTTNDDDITGLVKQIQRFEKETFDDKTFSTEKERYALFAGLSLILLIMDWLL